MLAQKSTGIIEVRRLPANRFDDVGVALRREDCAVELRERDFLLGSLRVDVFPEFLLVEIVKHHTIIDARKPARSPTIIDVHLIEDFSVSINDILAVHAILRCGETEQELRREIAHSGLIGLGGSVVGPVDNDVVEGVRRELVTVVAHGLKGGEEEVYGLSSFFVPCEHAVAIFFTKDISELRFGLNDDTFFITKKEGMRIWMLLEELLKVEDCGQGLSETTRHDDESFLLAARSSLGEGGDAFCLIRARLISCQANHSLSVGMYDWSTKGLRNVAEITNL